MEEINLFDYCKGNGLIKEGRRSGNTTRMIDAAIQLLFQGKSVYTDYGCREQRKAVRKQQNDILYDKIIKRLQAEHKGIYVYQVKENHSIYLQYE